MSGANDYLSKLEHIVSKEAEPNKEKLLGTVTDLFFLTKHQHSDDDVAIFCNVMEQLAYQIDLEPRSAFAERFADSDKCSRRLVLRLANDEMPVARPVLERSVCIDEEDLLKIAQSCDAEHLHALAGRSVISPLVTDAIVARGDEDALVRLAGNAGIVLSWRGYSDMLQHAEASKDLRDIVETRGVVGRDLVSKIWLRGMDWMGKLPHKTVAGPEAMKHIVIKSGSNDNEELAEAEDSAPDASAALKLAASGLLQYARSKNVPEVMRCLCTLTNSEQGKVKYFLLQAPVNAFGVFCRAHKIDSTTFAALLQLRVAAGALDTSDLIDALRRYDSLNPWRAQQLLQAQEEAQAEAQGEAADS